MHPVMARRERLIFYIASWAPLAALLAYLLSALEGVPLGEAIGVAIPLCVIYAPICLSAWYVCRAAPPRQDTGKWRTLATNVAAAAAVSSMWTGLASLLARFFPSGEQRIARATPLIFAFGALLYLLSAAFHYVLMMFDEARRAEAREMQASILAREAELKALKAQINPHFLFNCLNSISALTTSDPKRAREMCVLLGEFLRSTLGLGEKASIPLDDELALARSYLAVERVRFGQRLKFDESVEAGCGKVTVPPLLLQPLVENAVTHGIASLVEGGSLRLSVRFGGPGVMIAVENEFDPDAPARRRNGVGLSNVRKRLAARYGEHADFRAAAKDGVYRAEISLPVLEA